MSGAYFRVFRRNRRVSAVFGALIAQAAQTKGVGSVSRTKRGKTMKTAKLTLVSTVVAAAFGLMLGLMGAPGNSYACHRGADHGSQTCGGDDGGGGGSEGATKNIPISARIMDINTFDGDGVPPNLDYVDGEGGISANVGPGIFINISGHGKDPRQITVKVNCVDIGNLSFNPSIKTCVEIPSGRFDFERDHLFLAARAYGFNCPNGDKIDGECPNAFTILPGETAQMGFTVSFDGGSTRLDIASNVGGGGALSPGRCLYQMGEHQMIDERDDFLDANCRAPGGTPEDCNVTVKALDVVSDPDDRNDRWEVEAVNEKGLICGFEGREFVVYGMVEDVSFMMEANVE